MAWCPKCGCEYQEGVKKCADCGLRLIDHKPGKDELIPANDTPRSTGLRRIFTRERVLHMLRALRCCSRLRRPIRSRECSERLKKRLFRFSGADR